MKYYLKYNNNILERTLKPEGEYFVRETDDLE